MRKVATDRSRIETAQRCKRLRWLEYHEGGTGIVSAKKALPLAVGGAVHVGLATLVGDGQAALDANGRLEAAGKAAEVQWRQIEERAVEAALTDFAQFKSALDVGTEVTVPATVDASAKVESPVPSAYDDYLYAEQASLVEAMTRAYARRRLRPLLEEFEVLEVEREGAWTLAERSLDGDGKWIEGTEGYEPMSLMFLSRPDALLRHRGDGHLEILSYKTTGAWDVRKARDAEHDMQGLSEGIEVERRLAEWWTLIREHGGPKRGDTTAEIFAKRPWADQEAWGKAAVDGLTPSMATYLSSLPAPPRILAIRYEYLLKGERWKDRDLAARFGIDWARAQKSSLIRHYVCVSTPSRGANAGAFAIGDSCWSYDYHQEDGKTSKLSWQNWDSRLVTESGMTVREWIDKLDSATKTMAAADSTLGIEPREVGWSCDAQAVGFTAQHPLDAVFLPPMTVYRGEDQIRDLVEQMEAQETQIAEDVAAVSDAADEYERRSLLNRKFQMTRRACCYPTLCSYDRVCWGGEDIQRDPLASGLFKIRGFNHPKEGEFLEGKK